MNLPLTDLYETDFYAWTQKQVELLRQRNLNHLDIDNLIEEIESLGKQQQQEVISKLTILLGHLLKWEYQPTNRSRSWIWTIREQRKQVTKIIKKNPSLKSILDEAIKEAYSDAIDLAIDETGLGFKTFPSEMPYTWEQIENQNFYPGLLNDSDRDLLELYGIGYE